MADRLLKLLKAYDDLLLEHAAMSETIGHSDPDKQDFKSLMRNDLQEMLKDMTASIKEGRKIAEGFADDSIDQENRFVIKLYTELEEKIEGMKNRQVNLREIIITQELYDKAREVDR